MSDNLRGCPFCGSKVFIEIDEKKPIQPSFLLSCVCGVNMSSLRKKDIIKTWNTRHEPKHETVEQWEKRTGKVYPDDGPVWVEQQILKESRREWRLLEYKDIKKWDRIAVKYNTCAEKISIVANHHGKPE